MGGGDNECGSELLGATSNRYLHSPGGTAFAHRHHTALSGDYYYLQSFVTDHLGYVTLYSTCQCTAMLQCTVQRSLGDQCNYYYPGGM